MMEREAQIQQPKICAQNSKSYSQWANSSFLHQYRLNYHRRSIILNQLNTDMDSHVNVVIIALVALIVWNSV